MTRPPRFLPLLLTILVLCGGCRDEGERSVYRPGGPYVERLDAPGRRMTIDGPDGRPVLKVRASSERFKVYDAEMRRVGEVRWSDERVEVREELGQPWTGVTTDDGGAVTELEGRFRLERVADGWAVFDPKATLLGYVGRDEEGVWSLRDDFSSAPRLIARGAELEGPKGAVELRSSAAALEGPFLIATGLDELDALSQVALGAWFARQPSPEAAPGPDAG